MIETPEVADKLLEQVVEQEPELELLAHIELAAVGKLAGQQAEPPVNIECQVEEIELTVNTEAQAEEMELPVNIETPTEEIELLKHTQEPAE